MWLLSLWIFSTGAVISSILVITSVKAINAIISLILAFINAIGIFILLGVDFIALIYCIVYVGAIAILFLFVIMLLNSSTLNHNIESFNKPYNNLKLHNKNEKKLKNVLLNNRPMAILIGILYIVEVWCGFLANSWNREYLELNQNGIVSLLHNKSCISGLGEMFYKECGYEILLVISLILLVGMIGSIVLTLTSKKQSS